MHAFDPIRPQSRAPHFRWSPAQLADAVPPRLSELFPFSASDAPACANTARRPLPAATSYVPACALAPRFRIS
ncbi:hypothetical protein [Thermomonas brevis]